MPLERTAQGTSRPMNSRLHRLLTDVQQLGGLFDAQPLDHPCDKHDAKNLRQVVNGPFDEGPQFLSSHQNLRIGIVRRARPVGDVNDRSTPSDAAKSKVDRDAGEPSTHAGITSELLEVREDTNIGLLHHILGICVIAKNAARDAKQASVVALGQLSNGNLVSLLAAAEQLVVREAPRGRQAGRRGYEVSRHSGFDVPKA